MNEMRNCDLPMKVQKHNSEVLAAFDSIVDELKALSLTIGFDTYLIMDFTAQLNHFDYIKEFLNPIWNIGISVNERYMFKIHFDYNTTLATQYGMHSTNKALEICYNLCSNLSGNIFIPNLKGTCLSATYNNYLQSNCNTVQVHQINLQT